MRRTAILAALALALGGTTLAAQNAPPPPADGPGGAPHLGAPYPPPPMRAAADMLLGHTGELKLTDPQVVRLAAISRRAAARHEARRPPRPPAPGQRPSDAEMARMRQQHDQMREQTRADLRDALAILTPDQQAQAWEMMAHAPGRPGGPGGMRRPGGEGDRRGLGAPPPPPRDDRAPRSDDAPPPPRPQN